MHLRAEALHADLAQEEAIANPGDARPGPREHLRAGARPRRRTRTIAHHALSDQFDPTKTDQTKAEQIDEDGESTSEQARPLGRGRVGAAGRGLPDLAEEHRSRSSPPRPTSEAGAQRRSRRARRRASRSPEERRRSRFRWPSTNIRSTQNAEARGRPRPKPPPPNRQRPRPEGDPRKRRPRRPMEEPRPGRRGAALEEAEPHRRRGGPAVHSAADRRER